MLEFSIISLGLLLFVLEAIPRLSNENKTKEQINFIESFLNNNYISRVMFIFATIKVSLVLTFVYIVTASIDTQLLFLFGVLVGLLYLLRYFITLYKLAKSDAPMTVSPPKTIYISSSFLTSIFALLSIVLIFI